MADNRQGEQRASTIKSPSLLAGKIFDKSGDPLVASHASKGKVRYRYYVTGRPQKGGSPPDGLRIPAKEIETAVVNRLAVALDDPLSLLARLEVQLEPSTVQAARSAAESMAKRIRSRGRSLIRALIASVQVHSEHIELRLKTHGIRDAFGLPASGQVKTEITLKYAVRLTRTGLAMRLVEPNGRYATETVDRSLVELLVQARKWWARLAEGKTTIAALAREEGINDSWISRVVRLNFLAPEIIASIIEGRQPANLNGTALTTANQIPADWKEQRRLFSNA